jgi:predicted esterase
MVPSLAQIDVKRSLLSEDQLFFKLFHRDRCDLSFCVYLNCSSLYIIIYTILTLQQPAHAIEPLQELLMKRRRSDVINLVISSDDDDDDDKASSSKRQRADDGGGGSDAPPRPLCLIWLHGQGGPAETWTQAVAAWQQHDAIHQCVAPEGEKPSRKHSSGLPTWRYGRRSWFANSQFDGRVDKTAMDRIEKVLGSVPLNADIVIGGVSEGGCAALLVALDPQRRRQRTLPIGASIVGVVCVGGYLPDSLVASVNAATATANTRVLVIHSPNDTQVLPWLPAQLACVRSLAADVTVDTSFTGAHSQYGSNKQGNRVRAAVIEFAQNAGTAGERWWRH